MLKHEEIIKNLTPDKKLALVSDYGTDCEEFGVPCIKSLSLDDLNAAEGGVVPDFNALARSFNTDLAYRAAAELTLSCGDGANLLIIPDTSLWLNPYSGGFSEDACLSSCFTRAYISAVKNWGKTPCLPQCTIKQGDFAYLDKDFSERVLYERLLAPYSVFSEFSDVAAIASSARLDGTYAPFNALSNGYLKSVGKNNFLLNCGVAGSEEDLNSAVDRMIDFAKICASANGGSQSRENGLTDLGVSASEESLVLLKNENLLPVKRGANILVVGAPDFFAEGGESVVTYFNENGVNAQFAKGYKVSGEIDLQLSAEACELAKTVDCVILFMGFGERKVVKKLKLPANQLALADALSKVNANLCAVVSSDFTFDTGFDNRVSALVLSPQSGKYRLQAIANVLTGKSSPSGKLTSTFYERPDEYFDKLKKDKDAGRIKIGVFGGYMRGEEGVKYPFGHGLSYAKFDYSNFVTYLDRIEVTVKNTGSVAGAEVIQLYIGKSDSGSLRPKKELKAFKKIYLTAGESKTVTFPVSSINWRVYDKAANRLCIEGGTYNLYIGSSVADIRAETKLSLNGETVSGGGEKISDYLNSVPNVLSGGYMLNPVKITHSSNKKLFSGFVVAAFICFLVVAGIAVLHGAGIIALGEDRAALYALIVFAVFFALTLVAAIALFVFSRRSKKATDFLPVGESDVKIVQPQRSYEELFEEQFEDDAEIAEEEERAVLADEELEILKGFDQSVTFKTACDDFSAVAASHGLSIKDKTVKKILAAFGSSRLIIVRGSSQTKNEKLLKSLSAFFGTPEYITDATGVKTLSDYVLDADGMAQTPVLNALSDAAANKPLIHLASLCGVHSADIGDIFTPFLRYAVSPELAFSATVSGGFNERNVEITPNIWFVFALADGEPLTAIDLRVLETAAVIEVDAAEISEKVIAETKPFTYYQLLKLTDVAKDEYSLDEDNCWKRIDKLVKYVSSLTGLRTGNKTWLGFEKFAAIALSAGCEELTAMDTAVSAKLLPAYLGALNGKIPASDAKFMQTLEGFLGADAVVECKKLLTGSGFTEKL